MAQAAQTPALRKRILVVDDDADVLALIERILKTHADVVLATDGMQALEVLHRGPLPDLVITDVMMPRMDGLTLTRAMKADAKLSRIPIVMLTASAGPRDVIAGLNAGARHYVTKPFKAEDILEKVRKALHL